jgi:gag-polyprotein putative aspartyl protease
LVSKAQRIREQEARRRKKAEEKNQKKRPTKFDHTYQSANDLAILGPLVVVRWSVPAALEEKLAESGLVIPPPVFGAMMIDTGASSTCISRRAANELGLKPLRVATTYGAHGAQQSEVYLARLLIEIGHHQTRATTLIDYECEAQAVKDLEKFADSAGITRGGTRFRIVGLLGRDILRYARFLYNGTRGEISLDFDQKILGKAG